MDSIVPDQPEPIECPYCGKFQPWIWAMQLSGMGWCRPNSHKACAARAKAEERRQLTDKAVNYSFQVQGRNILFFTFGELYSGHQHSKQGRLRIRWFFDGYFFKKDLA